MSKQLVVPDDVHETLKDEAARRGMKLSSLVEEVIRTGLKVKRIDMDKGE